MQQGQGQERRLSGPFQGLVRKASQVYRRYGRRDEGKVKVQAMIMAQFLQPQMGKSAGTHRTKEMDTGSSLSNLNFMPRGEQFFKCSFG